MASRWLASCSSAGARSLNHGCCADCDPEDRVGCASGLVCGVDNCAQFHEISEATGFIAASDCCEGTHAMHNSAFVIAEFDYVCRIQLSHHKRGFRVVFVWMLSVGCLPCR